MTSSARMSLGRLKCTFIVHRVKLPLKMTTCCMYFACSTFLPDKDDTFRVVQLAIASNPMKWWRHQPQPHLHHNAAQQYAKIDCEISTSFNINWITDHFFSMGILSALSLAIFFRYVIEVKLSILPANCQCFVWRCAVDVVTSNEVLLFYVWKYAIAYFYVIVYAAAT